MKRLLAAAIACLFSTAVLAAPVAGKPAPDFAATDALTGKSIKLADFKGKNVVLEWNNFGCPFVQKFYNSHTMQGLQRRAETQGAVWITINSSAEGKEGYMKADAVKAELSKRDAHPSYYVLDSDGTIGKLYGAKSTPHMFVIDAKGDLAYSGAMDDQPTTDPKDIAHARNYVIEALAALDKGQPVKTAYTQSYGCFVKYAY